MMSATQIIAELQALPDTERSKVVKWLLNNDDDAFFAWADEQPIDRTMTEEEILSLPRMVPPDARSAR